MSESGNLGDAVVRLRERHASLWDPEEDYADQEHSDLALRTNRALSWLERADKEYRLGDASKNDADAAFIFLWIAFNAAYAGEIKTGSKKSERRRFGNYFNKLLSLDEDKAIYDAIWSKFSGPVRLLLDNKYLFRHYWKSVAGKPGAEDWEKRFSGSKKKAYSALSSNNNANVVLEVLFGRLYVLRNQLLHGGAKWDSSLNREAVGDGANILSHLVPIFIDLMLKNPGDTDWGKLQYPPIRRRTASRKTPPGG